MLTTRFVPGAPNWLDLGVPGADIDAAVGFYTGLLGWTHRSAGPEAGGYGFFLLDGTTVAAVGPCHGEDTPPGWTPYFHTGDADATAAAVDRAGGLVLAAPADVFTAGRLATFSDPTGAVFGVWQPRDTAGLGAAGTPGTLCWTELYTTDAAAAAAFYGSVFGWTHQPMDMGGDLVYGAVTPADAGGQAAHGGILQLQRVHLDAGSTSEWHPYFGVADCDTAYAAATRLGGIPLIPPTDVPGIGRIAMLLDPAKAAFALLAAAPDMP